MPQKRTKTILFLVFLVLLAVPCLAAVPPGRISVFSTPTGALACVDNATCDTTGATFTVEGNAWHSVVITQKGYGEWAETVYVTSDQTSRVDAYLDLDPSSTAINVTVHPGSGTVCLDNSDCRSHVGAAGSTGSTRFTGVSPGYHTISVESPAGFRDAMQLVEVALGKTADVNIELVSVATPITTAPATPPATGTVRVYVDHTGSTICLDNVDCYVNVGGSSGLGTGTVVFDEVSTDKAHIVTIAEEGYRPVSTPITVSKDMITTVDVKLQPISTDTPIPTLNTATGATQTAMVPPAMPTARSAPGLLPVIGALCLCCVVFLIRNNRK